jgi:tetratricopeptide (TPR) repeat protein
MPRTKLFQDLDNFLKGPSPALCITGPTGCGKTTLLAQWVAARKNDTSYTVQTTWHTVLKKFGLELFAQHKPTLWLLYSANGTTSASRLGHLLNTFVNQLSSNLAATPPLTRSLKETLREFHRLLAVHSSEYGLIILIIDGIDDLRLGSVLPFHWVPQGQPNLKIILSGRTGGAETFLPPDGWKRQAITGLTVAERSEALHHYLKEFGKNIPITLLKRIADVETVAQPLFLRSLADELRLGETPEHMQSLSDTLLEAKTPRELFAIILDRLEADYSHALVASVSSLLAISRGGLEEAEIRAIIRAQIDVSGVQWSSLMRKFSRSTVDRDGRYGLYYDELSSIVWQRYLSDPKIATDFRDRLINWFVSELAFSPIPSQRTIEELPWQLALAGAWDRLESLLSTPAFFDACWSRDPNQTIEYWRTLEAALGARAPAACIKMAATLEGSPKRLIDLALLLAELGHLDAAIDLANSMRQFPWEPSNAPVLASNLLNLAGFLQEANRLDDAGAILRELQERLSERNIHSLSSAIYSALGNYQLAQGNYSAAIESYGEAEILHHERRDEYGQYISRHNQAQVLLYQGKLTDAARLFSACAAYFRSIHAIETLIDTLLGLMTAKEKAGKLKSALTTCLEAEQLARVRNDPFRLSRSLDAKARLLEVQDDRDGAEEAQVERAILCQKYSDKDGEIGALIARAIIRMNVGPIGHNSALRLLSQAASLAIEEQYAEQRGRITKLTQILGG